jgi:hypothetical protein
VLHAAGCEMFPVGIKVAVHLVNIGASPRAVVLLGHKCEAAGFAMHLLCSKLDDEPAMRLSTPAWHLARRPWVAHRVGSRSTHRAHAGHREHRTHNDSHPWYRSRFPPHAATDDFVSSRAEVRAILGPFDAPD